MNRGGEVRYLTKIRIALDDHNSRCVLAARAILLNEKDYKNLGMPTLWGVPVHSDKRVSPDRVVIDCEGSARFLEDEVAEIAS